jgi:hyperosmotically inducible protein
MTRSVLMLTALALGALLAGAASADQGREDYQVFKDVTNRVRTYTSFTIFDDVRASVDNGVVTLSGRVTMGHKRGDLERRVAKVPGVHTVRNEITVLPASQFDDELRYGIARAIYGNPSFWHYASMANPPIHIVVEDGHVTLSGVVHSEVERVLARSIASGSLAFSVSNQLQTDAEVQAAMEQIR